MNMGWDAEVERRALAEADRSGPDWDVCPYCEGSGSELVEDHEDGQYIAYQRACSTCKGDGRVDYSPCIVCGTPAYDGHEEGCPIGQPEVRGS
jgi:DnaJ-class molecular chaperone